MISETQIKQVIIWGFPLHSHTHSYIHYAWHKAFSFLKFKTFWFHDDGYPSATEFDYSDSIFLTEGYADRNIPLNKTSTYFVHVCVHPEKYFAANVKRLIDMRYLVYQIKDVNYSYVFDKTSCRKVSDVCFHQKLCDTSGVTSHQHHPISVVYEAIYVCWATDLLPHEIDLEWASIPRLKVMHFIGSIDKGNDKNYERLFDACRQHGVSVVCHNPWTNPLPFDTVRQLVQESYIAPDLRGDGVHQHKFIGYIPCRIFKNISYGQLGCTNSKAVLDVFKGRVIYDDNEYALFEKASEAAGNVELVRSQMRYVQENHTFVNRVNDLLDVLAHPMTD
jgi:hypothetical protein